MPPDTAIATAVANIFLFTSNTLIIVKNKYLFVLKTTVFQHAKDNTPRYRVCNKKLTKKQQFPFTFIWVSRPVWQIKWKLLY